MIKVKNNEKRLDIFLSNELKKTRSEIKKMLKNNMVFINGKIENKAGRELKINDEILIRQNFKKNDCKPINLNIPIVYEDETLYIINKPKNLLSVPSKYENLSILNYAKHLNNNSDLSLSQRYGLLHRLDKNTTGLLIIAKNKESYQKLKPLIENKLIERKYLALVHGNFKNNKFVIDVPLSHSKSGKSKIVTSTKKNSVNAITNVKVIEQYNKYSLVECQLITGRTNQIRAHMEFIKHPIYNDEVYGKYEGIKNFGQFLHAYKISFINPITNKKIIIKLELPNIFLNKIMELKKC